MTDTLYLDGAHGEGGGQILRSALALSALTGRAFRLGNLRARRDQPGLRPQHLAAVRAVARICCAAVEGDTLGSMVLSFAPSTPPLAGTYLLDISTLAGSGSAGAVTLLYQALHLPLALSEGQSNLELRGGTHVAWSPPYHYLSQVYLPAVRRMGVKAEVELCEWGWYPQGGGRVRGEITGIGLSTALAPLDLLERGKLQGVTVLSAASNLPDHVAQRQAQQALRRLRHRHIKADVELVDAPSMGTGTLLLVLAAFERLTVGFSAYGRVRYPAERVADDALDELEAYWSSKAALDPYLADQLLLPMALAAGESRCSCARVTRHLLTNAWLIPHFYPREIAIEGREGAPGTITVR